MSSPGVAVAAGQRSQLLVALVFLVFFTISFLTNILGPLVPDIISGFHVSLAMAAVLPFSFFIAYGVMSIPAGFLVEAWGEKRLMVAAFLAGAAGALAFVLSPRYPVAIASLFVMGCGMAALQVAINPLLRVAGGEEHFAFNSAFAQLVFGAASFASPLVYSWLVGQLGAAPVADGAIVHLLRGVTPAALPWLSIYWLFAAGTLLMAVFIGLLRLPVVERTGDESAGTLDMYRQLARSRATWLYLVAIIAYVGCEQGSSLWISEFLYRYHGYDPHVQGAAAVSRFWGLMTVGCLGGMLLLKLYDSRRVLAFFCVGALLMLTLGLFGTARVAYYALPAIGLFASVMWPTLVSLALNSVRSHHGPFAGILCSGIMGGALVPLLIGRLGDAFGLRTGMLVLYVTFGYVLGVAFWARPLVANATLSQRKATMEGAT